MTTENLTSRQEERLSNLEKTDPDAKVVGHEFWPDGLHICLHVRFADGHLAVLRPNGRLAHQNREDPL